MCGIVGMLHFNGPAIRLQQVEQARDLMAHRGPDDAGLWLSSDHICALGHRRLSIIDLSPAGHQPMNNEDSSIWIVYNGEIYNFMELRSELQARGHFFKSHTDTEVLVHGYEQYGVELVDRIQGMFAFAIWDQAKGMLLLARDRLGEKPLYYSHDNHAVCFASELKALLALKRKKPELNVQCLGEYLAFGHLIPPNTLVKDVHKLRPGYVMTFTREGACREIQYWSPYKNSKIDAHVSDHDEDSIADCLYGLLQDSVRRRLISDAPVGIFLSGGLDSSIVAATAHALGNRALSSFSLVYNGYPQYNEDRFANKVAQQFRTHHSLVRISANDAKSFLPKFAYYQEEPHSDIVWFSIYFLAEAARAQGIKVILTGDGGDELFCGYSKWMQYLRIQRWFWRPTAWIPIGLRRLMAPALHRFLHDDIKIALVDRWVERQELFWGGTNFKRHEIRDILEQSLMGTVSYDPYHKIVDIRKNFQASLAKAANQTDWMCYLSLHDSLLEDYLMRLDKMGMAASIEGRTPFLDHRLVEYAMRIPSYLKHRGFEAKYILKKAAEKLLPSEIVYRRKMGFQAPLSEWMMHDFRQSFLDAIIQFQASAKVFAPKFVKSLPQALDSGRMRFNNFWLLSNLSLWHQKWIA